VLNRSSAESVPEMTRTFRFGLFISAMIGLGFSAGLAQPGPGLALRPLPIPANPTLPSLFIIGASDVRNGRGDGRDKSILGFGGLWGWGEPLAQYFDAAKINVVNRAVGGLSGRTYQTMGYWEATLALMKPGDFLIVAFGVYDPQMINDPQRPHGMLLGLGEETTEIDNVVTHRHEVVHTFGWYERKFIADAQARGVVPILCSNVASQVWKNGKIVRIWAKSADPWMAELARAAGLAYLPIDELIARRYDELGPKKTAALFGRGETVHTNAAGADLNARMVVAALKALPQNPLAAFLSEKAAEILPENSRRGNR
jgi:lysophospholipase L1-like esterase